MRVGFVGLGNLGRPLATSLVTAGHGLVVHDLDRKAEGDHEHARLHPSRRDRGGPHAGPPRRARPRPELPRHRRELGDQLRARDGGSDRAQWSYDVGATLDIARKDLGFAHELGRELRTPLELAALVEQIFVRAREQYGGTAQSTMAVKLLEDALGVDLRADGFPARLGFGPQRGALDGSG